VNQNDTTAAQAGANNGEEDVPRRALLFELENVAFEGHNVLYNTVKKTLAAKDAKLSEVLFTRFCLDSTVGAFLPDLLNALGRRQLSADKLREQIGEQYTKALTVDGRKMNAGLGRILDAAEKKCAVGALSCLEQDAAEAIGKQPDLTRLGVIMRARDPDQTECSSRDGWRKLANDLAVFPSLCVAITTNAAACRSALAAGMRVVVCPSKYAQCQDFGGADAVFDELSGAAVDFVMASLECD